MPLDKLSGSGVNSTSLERPASICGRLSKPGSGFGEILRRPVGWQGVTNRLLATRSLKLPSGMQRGASRLQQSAELDGKNRESGSNGTRLMTGLQMVVYVAGEIKVSNEDSSIQK